MSLQLCPPSITQTSPRPEQGSCLVAGTVTLYDDSFRTNINIQSDPAAMHPGCVALLCTGSPQTFINSNALKIVNATVAATVVCERRSLCGRWVVLGSHPSRQTGCSL